VGQLQKEDALKKSIVATANSLASYRTPAIDIKSSLMSNLIDIHLALLSTSEQVEQRNKIMYANCMKAQPDVPCPR
jgi:hypothetical protein